MNLTRFLENLIKEDGFVLIDANAKEYIIGKPKKINPIKIRLLDKSLHYKLLFLPDLYFGEAYANGSLVIENGTLTEFLDIAMKNIGRSEINSFSKIIKKIKGTYRYFTNFNLDEDITSFVKKAFEFLSHSGKILIVTCRNDKFVMETRDFFKLNFMWHTIMIFLKNYMIYFWTRIGNIHVHILRRRLIL